MRIRCGGDDWTSPRGARWGRDRFYTGGGTQYLFGRGMGPEEIAFTEDGPLYRTERYFVPVPRGPKGYRIPLPPGGYRVALHFAEIHEPARNRRENGFRRVFDVRLEGKTVLEEYDPGAKGFAAADVRTFEVAVEDGILDIEFVHRVENPKVSAIEVIRLK